MKTPFFKKFVFIVVILQFLTGFTQNDGIVELKEHAYARTSAMFSRARHDNKIGVLSPGTRGQISERVLLPSGNYGLRIRILNGPRAGEEAWVYYNPKRPTLALYDSENQTVKAAESEKAVTAVTKESVPAIPETEKVTAAPGAVTTVCLSENRAKLTHYNSDPRTYRNRDEANLEGGSKTRFSEPLNSMEQAIENGRPVSLAGDSYGNFGQRCNRRDSRCTLLVHSKGFDKRFPAYKTKFPGLPADSFVGIIEDTGNAFSKKGTAKIDLAVRDRKISTGVSDTKMQFTEIKSPCGKSRSARYCNLSGLKLVDQCQVTQNRVTVDASLTTTARRKASASGIR